MSKTYKDILQAVRKRHRWDDDIPYHNPKVRNLSKKHYKWYRYTPGWWVSEFMEKPFRSRTRNKLKQILNGRLDPEDDIDWDNGRKPHVYYW